MTDANILIVEDEAIVAKDLQNRLRKFGYTVLGIASSGQDAINKAVEISPDLVLMDIRLKGAIDGIEAAEKIHQYLDIPII
jgi:CheY-like chemotaxis protein